jgi:alkylation response protein AidB-like acyl-CoA dehydrogenase
MAPPIVAAVRDFVARDVRPHAAALDHADAYPHDMVARMRELGLFGSLVPSAYGGLGLDVTTYARIIEEICRGWMSLAGVLNSHTMAALIVLHHGSDEQRARLLPRFASGAARGGLCLTEPHAGSDVQAIRTVARRDGDRYLLQGSKMFVTNGREGNTFALLALTDPKAEPRHRGMSCFIVEKGHPGLHVVKSIAKLGYKGVDTAELLFEDFPVPAANLVGGLEGRGFKHVMSGLEAGRINIAARAVGVAQAAWDTALADARERAMPDPRLAEMAGRLHGARLLTYWAAGMKDRSERCDLEAGMAKLHASETAQAVAEDAMRVLGERAVLLSAPVERCYRDTPLMIIGEGTNEIQRTIIARQLVDRYGERAGALVAHEAPGEQRQMVLAVRQIVDKEIGHLAQEYEQSGRAASALLPTLSALGLLAAPLPAGAGGLALAPSACAMLLEEIARGWGSLAALVASHVTAVRALAAHARTVATPGGRPGAGRDLVLAALGRGDRRAAISLAGNVTVRHDRDEFTLTGETALVEGAANTHVLVVAAARAENTQRAAGSRGRVLVELPLDARGVRVGAPEPVLGLTATQAARVTLDDVRVDGSAMLDEGAFDDTLAFAHLMTGAIAIGVAQAAFEAALRYAQQRSAFGKPISQHQAIQLKLADMATAVSAARLLVADAAADPILAAVAKLQATATASRVTLESMRTHGGYGYTAEFPVERHYRDAARLVPMPIPEDDTRADVAARLVSLDGPWPSNVDDQR